MGRGEGQECFGKPRGKGNQPYYSLGEGQGLNWFQESRGLETVSNAQDVVEYVTVMVLFEKLCPQIL